MEESCKNLRHPNTKMFWLPIKIYNRFRCELHEVVTVDVDRDLSTTCFTMLRQAVRLLHS